MLVAHILFIWRRQSLLDVIVFHGSQVPAGKRHQRRAQLLDKGQTKMHADLTGRSVEEFDRGLFSCISALHGPGLLRCGLLFCTHWPQLAPTIRPSWSLVRP